MTLSIKSISPLSRLLLSAILLSAMLSGCLPLDMASPAPTLPTETPAPTLVPTPEVTRRPVFPPGELVDYTAQAGDTLAALAVRFNTTVREIRDANAFIPPDATTMPPGMPMKIPIYYEPLWGSTYQIIPDSLFVNGPASVTINLTQYIAEHPGWLKQYRTHVLDRDRSAAEMIDYIALHYSVSPQLLLALTEFYLQGLSEPQLPADIHTGYVLGLSQVNRNGLYRQLSAASNELNNIYYDYRAGLVTEFVLSDGELVRPDPWQNAATVALQVFFARHLPADRYHQAISENGIASTFRNLFGDPWSVPPSIPGSLRQPTLRLPFMDGTSWTYTGGPHTAWGSGSPFSAIDFAPPVTVGGCKPTNEYAVAAADGIISRTDLGIAVLDLDGDGDERTGWVLFYLHIATENKIRQGQVVLAGTRIGHPSCEGGSSTGTHIHIARKYNGEWIPAGGIIPFNLDGWIVSDGDYAYAGSMERNGRRVVACTCSDIASQIQADFH